MAMHTPDGRLGHSYHLHLEAPVWHLIYRLTLLSEQESQYGDDLCLGFLWKHAQLHIYVLKHVSNGGRAAILPPIHLKVFLITKASPHLLAWNDVWMQIIYVCLPRTFWSILVFVLCLTFNLRSQVCAQFVLFFLVYSYLKVTNASTTPAAISTTAAFVFWYALLPSGG